MFDVALGDCEFGEYLLQRYNALDLQTRISFDPGDKLDEIITFVPKPQGLPPSMQQEVAAPPPAPTPEPETPAPTDQDEMARLIANFQEAAALANFQSAVAQFQTQQDEEE